MLLHLQRRYFLQLVIDKVQSVDLKRTFLFTVLGFALVGPTLHFWYLYLSKLVSQPGASGAILRLVLDQEWFSAVLANWQLWIPFQFFNFRFVPQQFQVRVTEQTMYANWELDLTIGLIYSSLRKLLSL
ncbi:hypothetical protein Lal_00000965 [Lupinus albus]|nr:hypothetical protein Lal_00000965 [Lupinus albus]